MTFRFSIKPYFTKPRRLGGATSPKLTIASIMRQVPSRTRVLAAKTRVIDASVLRTPSGVPKDWTTYRIVTLNTTNGHRYRLTIFSPTPRITRQSKIMIDDPNPLFVFKYEYAMAHYGNAFIYRTNGDYPHVTNPRLQPGLSHHGVRALMYLIKKTENIK